MLVKDLLNTIKKNKDYIDIEIYVEKENNLNLIKSFTLYWLDLEDGDLYLPKDLANSVIKEFEVYENGNILFQIII